MPNSFLNLPRNILKEICLLLEYKVLKQLKQTCTKTKEIVGNFMENLEVEFYQFCIGNGHILFFRWEHSQNSIWKSQLVSLLIALNLPITHNENRANYLQINFDNEHMDSFLKLLKPLVKNWRFQGVTFGDVTANQIRVCSEIFKGKLIETVDFLEEGEHVCADRAYFTEALKFIELIKPFDGYYIAKMITQDFLEFMVQVSGTVQSIWIHGCDVHDSISEIGFRTIRRMPQRKCETLRIHGKFPLLTLSDVEKLMQEFSHLEKPYRLLTQINSDQIEVQIGRFKIKIDGRLDWRFVSITHLELDKLN